jgi:orotate phosphoribosyltransferase
MIIEDCLKFGDFTLSSGGKSDYFIDLNQIYLDGNGAYLIGKMLYHSTKGLVFDAIGGPVAGAIPLVAATVVQYWRREHLIKTGFYVRWERNAHGGRTYQGIEGRVTSMHKAIVIEDVCTTGASAALAVQAVQELAGCEVVMVVALVDREEGARERFQEMGIPFKSIFTAKKLLNYADKKIHLVSASAVGDGEKT